jgi:hypothetical protein
VQNNLSIIVKSLSPVYIELFYRFVFYHLLYTKFFYYSLVLLFLKNQLYLSLSRNISFRKRRVYTILRSPFIHKKSREQFEYRVSKSSFLLKSNFNFFYRFSPFTGQWVSLIGRSFRNNHVQIKSSNFYYLKF